MYTYNIYINRSHLLVSVLSLTYDIYPLTVLHNLPNYVRIYMLEIILVEWLKYSQIPLNLILT